MHRSHQHYSTVSDDFNLFYFFFFFFWWGWGEGEGVKRFDEVIFITVSK